MKSILRNKLNRFGFNAQEIDAIDSLISLGEDMKLLNDRVDDDRKIEQLIREKISLSKELSILRKQAMGVLPIEEWDDYCTFIQECIDKILK